jgi:hypothetical protein
MEDSQTANRGSERVIDWPVQVASDQPAQDEPEPVTNGHVKVASDQPAQNGSEPVKNGKVKVADQQGAHVQAEPAVNGHSQIVNELEQATREGAQPARAEERLPSHFSQSINDALTRRQTLPGFADPRLERINSIELPPWFIDRCRSAYLSVKFDPATECRVIGVTSAAYGEGKTSGSPDSS